ncbi:hypothetical protein [Portibacter lacus]|uniref:hypothetical protein n=1 Tax=Portibacter lacus TaxID=1099794 RepID=UPI001F22A322|nr:hypothetical protein [Portibacter lacus]
MIQPWVYFWFFAVVIYIIGKTIKDRTFNISLGNKFFVLSPMILTNLIALVLGSVATYLMLTNNYNF